MASPTKTDDEILAQQIVDEVMAESLPDYDPDDDEEPDDELEPVAVRERPTALATVEPMPRPTAMDSGKATFMSMDDVNEVASMVLHSRLVPGLRTVEEAAVKIMLGREMGLTPMKACQDLYVVHGRVSMSAGIMAAMIRKSDRYTYRVVEHDNEHCVIDFFEKSLDGSEWEAIGQSDFDMDDARTAGLVKGGSGWANYPRNMLFARALSNGARWYCPDVFAGSVYTPEELESSFISEAPAESTDEKPKRQRRNRAASEAPAPAPIEPEPQPVDVDRTEYTEEMNKLPVDETRTEICPLHGIEFFKTKRMKSHAHKLPGNQWCNWRDVFKELGGQMNAAFAEQGMNTPDEKEAWIHSTLADLQGVDAKRYRLQDLSAILRQLKADAENGGGEDEGDSEDA